ncbi:MAG: undecaprenyl-diphosphate phosphatase [Oscillospiraceae bacterium]|nr:undecaprenyl-diphosphate phosphatase [Oscillospiraceae bacterium]
MTVFFEFLKAVLFGIVQGITEWLPISSTGHMILLDELVQLDVSDAFYELFQVVIQLGSVLAVLVLYFHRLNPFSPQKSPQEKQRTWQMWFKVVVGVLPLVVPALLLDDFIDEHFYNYTVVAIALIVYGVLFILVENRSRSRKPQVTQLEQLSYGRAALVGVVQMLAIIPGTSRSGSTILGAMLLGLDRSLAAEFSFFMAIPVMAGASGLKAVKYLLEGGLAFTSTEWMILITGTVVAFLVSLVAIRFLVQFVKKHDFKAFGAYRIVLGLVVLAYFLLAR